MSSHYDTFRDCVEFYRSLRVNKNKLANVADIQSSDPKHSFTRPFYPGYCRIQNPIRVVAILDDYPVFVEGLKTCLDRHNIEVRDAEFLFKTSQTKSPFSPPDILLVGISQSNRFDIQVYSVLKRIFPGIPMMLIVDNLKFAALEKLKEIGILGCISHNCQVQDFLQAFEFACNGTFYINPKLIQPRQRHHLSLSSLNQHRN